MKEEETWASFPIFSGSAMLLWILSGFTFSAILVQWNIETQECLCARGISISSNYSIASQTRTPRPDKSIISSSQVSDLRSYRSYSNQQCVVPNLAFGVPIVVADPAKRLLGTFGCVIWLKFKSYIPITFIISVFTLLESYDCFKWNLYLRLKTALLRSFIYGHGR